MDRRSFIETMGALAASALLVGGASAQDQRPRRLIVAPVEFDVPLSPEARAERDRNRRRWAATNPMQPQREMDESERQARRDCAVFRRRILQGDPSVEPGEWNEMTGFCSDK
ncbi:MAG: hypothetical protein WC880_02395 [Candidatus Paceibacterota bacterium]